MSARRGPGFVRRLLDLDRTAGAPPALTGRDDAVDDGEDLVLAGERDEALRAMDRLATQLAEVTEERDEARRAADIWRGKYDAAVGDLMAAQRTAEDLDEQRERLEGRIADVEGQRDRMYSAGQAAVLVVAQVRRLADLWAADPRIDGLAAQLHDVLAGGEPR